MAPAEIHLLAGRSLFNSTQRYFNYNTTHRIEFDNFSRPPLQRYNIERRAMKVLNVTTIFCFLFVQVLLQTRCEIAPFSNVSEYENYIRNTKTEVTRLSFYLHQNMFLNVVALDALLVESMLVCAMNCGREKVCFSFNLAKNADEGGQFRCDLLQTDMYNSSANLQWNKHFNHFSILVSYELLKILSRVLFFFNVLFLNNFFSFTEFCVCLFMRHTVSGQNLSVSQLFGLMKT